jgi:BirA family biotin operon repressor/biotin-[acetyl-CoA-carboxylase] ligase
MMNSAHTEFEDLTAPVRGRAFDGQDAARLAERLAVPKVELFERVTSTLDVAHKLAREGAPAGTLVLSEEQTAGRGRAGRVWKSRPGSGIWMTLIERPSDKAAVEVLSLRVGIRVAPLLDAFTDEPVSLKWPNDLLVNRAKLAGVLIETRWRGAVLDWVAIGFGINVTAPPDLSAAAVKPGTDRVELLSKLIAGIRSAAFARGPLTGAELSAFGSRDVANGRRCSQPVRGIARGINAQGALLVERAGSTAVVREGSLVLED